MRHSPKPSHNRSTTRPARAKSGSDAATVTGDQQLANTRGVVWTPANKQYEQIANSPPLVQVRELLAIRCSPHALLFKPRGAAGSHHPVGSGSQLGLLRGSATLPLRQAA